MEQDSLRSLLHVCVFFVFSFCFVVCYLQLQFLWRNTCYTMKCAGNIFEGCQLSKNVTNCIVKITRKTLKCTRDRIFGWIPARTNCIFSENKWLGAQHVCDKAQKLLYCLCNLIQDVISKSNLSISQFESRWAIYMEQRFWINGFEFRPICFAHWLTHNATAQRTHATQFSR